MLLKGSHYPKLAVTRVCKIPKRDLSFPDKTTLDAGDSVEPETSAGGASIVLMERGSENG
jgi:hypothetical protein